MANLASAHPADAQRAPSEPLAQSAILALAAVAICGLALYVHWPYFRARHVHDDLRLLLLVSWVQTGRLPWTDLLTRVFDFHWFPAWLITYDLQTRLCGLNPRLWHANVLAAHLASAALLGYLLVRMGLGRAGALAAAAVWALAAVGRAENPLLWLATGCITYGLLAFLGAMACVPGIGSPHQRWWALAMSLSLAVAIPMFGPLLLLTPALVAQYVLFERRGAISRRRQALWGLAWIAPVVGLGVAQLSLTLPAVASEAPRQSSASLLVAPLRSVAQMAEALAILAATRASELATHGLGLKLAGLAAALAVALALAREARRALVFWFALAWVYLIVVNLARADDPLDSVLSSGRYLYVPMLASAVLIGSLVDAIARRLRTAFARRLAAVALAVAVAALALHQRRVAVAAMVQFDRFWSANVQKLDEADALLAWLSARGAEDQRVVRLVDIPLELPPVASATFPLSGYVRLAHPRGLPLVEVAAAEQISFADAARSVALLERAPLPGAAAWARSMRFAWDLDHSIRWLAQFAAERHLAARLLDAPVSLPPFETKLSEFLYVFQRSPLPNLAVVRREQLSVAETEALLAALAESPDPQARRWETIFNQLLARQVAPADDRAPAAPEPTREESSGAAPGQTGSQPARGSSPRSAHSP